MKMRETSILVINAGSTSLKCDVLAVNVDVDPASVRRLTSVRITEIGGTSTFTATVEATSQQMDCPDLGDHASATRFVLDWLAKSGTLHLEGLDGIAHRIVHGGSRRFEPTIIAKDVLTDIASANELAPLHNGPALDAIAAAQDSLPGVPMVAVFDTSFFRDLPDPARLYAIPRRTAEQHGIRRYGFHGIAHRYMAGRATELLGGSRRIITLQLGGGCSAAAILNGRPIDTTMGMTPLEGLVMATRSGDIDPSIVRVLMRRESQGPEEIDRWLNEQCGLLGVSGASADMRALLDLEGEGHAAASLAIEMFCIRVRKCIGAYMSVLSGADAIVFGGGIGEHSAEVRSRICRGMDWCGLMVSDEANREANGREQLISNDASKINALVISVDEAILIANDAAKCLRRHVKETSP